MDVPRLRATAMRNAKGEWDWDAILNRELYPAIRALIAGSRNTFPPVRLAGASNALKTSYDHKNVLVSHPTAATLTLPESVSRSMPSGSILIIGQEGVGTLTLAGEGSVVINSQSTLSTTGQWSELFLLKIGDLEWVLFGGAPVDLGPTINMHETNENTVAHYTFQDTLVESVGGFNINQDGTGNPITGVPPADDPGYMFLRYNNIWFCRFNDNYRHSATGTALLQAGELKIVDLILHEGNYAGGRIFEYIGADSDASANDNIQYGVRYLPGASGFWLRYIHEHGVGTDFTHDVRQLPATGQVTHFGLQRFTDGSVQIWLNGAKAGARSAASTLPTGGSAARIFFNGNAARGPISHASWRLDTAAGSDQDMVDDYNHTLGEVSGFIT